MSEADLLSAGTALIDTHAHLDDERFAGEIDEILERAEEAGIRQILTVGESPETFEATIALAEKYPQLFAAIGIHPQQADKGTPEALARIEQLARAHAKVVAIGEIGFDYYYEYAPRPVQEEVFRAQLRMAQSLELPFIVHDRDAHDDTLRVLREEAQGHKLRGVLHCFSGDASFAEGCLELGLHLAFGGTLTYPKNAGLRAVAATVPEDRLLLETDCPYLAPQKRRGKRNEPAFMRLTAEKLAEERGITLEELAAITSHNAEELFGMGQTARIAYVIRDALYLNITNRCSNACVFCAKFHGYTIGENFLRLEREP
ncbi:MAG: YchF/TatD family DNA exonuclease, partial [Deltaproteobacteria bacterium]|nr:YchF/TatD family DNA exonuclease [Deltaproteobacteria bacterium]